MALKAYEGILKAIERLPLNYYQYNLVLADSLNDLAHMRLGVLKFAFLRACRILLYLGLIGAPFSLLLWPSWLVRQSPRGRVVHLAWVGGLTAVVTLALAWTGNLIPLLDPGSMLSDLGLGVRTLSGPWPPAHPAVCGWP